MFITPFTVARNRTRLFVTYLPMTPSTRTLMNKYFTLAALTLMMLGCHPNVNGQTAAEASTERKARILANLEHQFPQIAQLNPEMGDLEATEIPGLDMGSFIVTTRQGRQVQRFLVTVDNTQLYLVAAGPIDVSRSGEELAAEAAAIANKTHLQLAPALEGMPLRGNPDAPITIVEFSDFQCPYCSRASQTVEQVLDKYKDEVNLVYLHFPLGFHPWARPAAIAAVCTANQQTSAFWQLHDYYFANQSAITEDNVLENTKRFLVNMGLDMAVWSDCAENAASPAYVSASALVDNTTSLGTSLGVSGTPGFFINGHFLSGAQPLSEFERVISEARGSVQ